MDEQRFVVTDRVWQRLEAHLPGKIGDAGATAKDNRLFLEAVFWRVRTGRPGSHRVALARPAARPWKLEQPVPALPKVGEDGHFRESFQRNERGPRPRIRAHRRHHRFAPSEGIGRKRGTQHQAIGRSRGGLATRIVALVDALGNLVRFLLLPGQAHDMRGVAPLIRDVPFGALLADKAFDANWLLEELDTRGRDSCDPAEIEPQTPARRRRRSLQVAAPGRELFRKDQGIQRYSNAIRQDRLQLCRQLEPRCCPQRLTMIVHRA